MSVAQEFDNIIKTYDDKIAQSSLRQDSIEFQNLLSSIIEKLLDLKNTIYTNLSLFSDNESVDDIGTSTLKYLAIDYHLAIMFARKQVTVEQVKDPNSRNRLKLKFLEKSLQLFMQFIVSLREFRILDSKLSKKVDSFEHTYRPSLGELYSQPSDKNDLSGAQLKRQQKIDTYRATKAINEKLKLLESKFNGSDLGTEDTEEVLRELYLQKLLSLAYDAFDNVEKILYECELLENFTQNPESTQSKPEDTTSADPTGYTEKLESLNKPLISKEGKVLRNFTLIDRKSELQKKVRGYGQYGPTMSVEEFLEKEWESGRVLQGGEDTQQHSKEDAEDNYELNDIETLKAREWDEFKENNPRGGGNTLNRG